MKNRHSILWGTAWLLVIALIVVSVLTLLGTALRNAEIADRYRRLDEIREALMDEYYLEVDEETLIEGAIDGMMASLEDPYTFYYTPAEMAEHDREMGEEYSGVGLLVQSNADGLIEVIRVYAGGPAAQAGVCVGDVILRVDGEKVSGESAQSLSDAVEMMQAQAGSKVELTIRRDGAEMQLEVVPDVVQVSNVAFSVLEGEIGYINIFQFGGDVVNEFENALESLENSGVKGLIVDVRNNPGGLLDDVVEIADSLLGEGLIVYIEDRDGDREEYRSDAEHCDLPLVVLINEMSASASEILAAAVQDHDRGEIIGQQSYGKGIVQTLARFSSDGAGMQYTSACYYTPNGKNIHGTGVTPDQIVEAGDAGDAYAEIPNAEQDLQLRAALNFLCGA